MYYEVSLPQLKKLSQIIICKLMSSLLEHSEEESIQNFEFLG